jgi:hypothetical protein
MYAEYRMTYFCTFCIHPASTKGKLGFSRTVVPAIPAKKPFWTTSFQPTTFATKLSSQKHLSNHHLNIQNLSGQLRLEYLKYD